MVKNKIFLISRSVPPATTGSAVIAGNLGRQFGRAEMILAGELPIGEPPLNWHKDWAKLVYISTGLPKLWRGKRWWIKLQMPFMLLYCLYLIKANACSVIVAVFPEKEYLLVGYVCALLTGCKFYLYFHNTFVENSKGLNRIFARLFQGLMFRKMESLLVLSQGLEELYRKNYPAIKINTITHSFNGELPGFQDPPTPNLTLHLVISGNINETCRDAVLRISEAVYSIKNAKLTFLSGTPKSYLVRLGLLRKDDYYDTVSYDEVINRLKQADIVVLPLGFSGKHSQDEYQTIFPTRAVDYFICGRPILAHASRGSYLARFLKENDCAIVVEEPSVAALVEAIQLLRTDADLRSRLVANALKAARQFRATYVAGVLRSVISGR